MGLALDDDGDLLLSFYSVLGSDETLEYMRIPADWNNPSLCFCVFYGPIHHENQHLTGLAFFLGMQEKWK